MKKMILALALMVTVASCGAPTEAEAPKADSTVVAVDSAASCATDSACADTAVVGK